MTDVSESRAPRRIAVIGAPIDMGASQRGTLMGPAALRTAGLVTVLDSLGFEVGAHGGVLLRDLGGFARPATRQRQPLSRNPALDACAEPPRLRACPVWRSADLSRRGSLAVD